MFLYKEQFAQAFFRTWEALLFFKGFSSHEWMFKISHNAQMQFLSTGQGWHFFCEKNFKITQDVWIMGWKWDSFLRKSAFISLLTVWKNGVFTVCIIWPIRFWLTIWPFKWAQYMTFLRSFIITNYVSHNFKNIAKMKFTIVQRVFLNKSLLSNYFWVQILTRQRQRSGAKPKGQTVNKNFIDF